MAKIDFKGAVSKMAAHAAGAAGYTQLNKMKFMTSLAAKGGPMKGIVTALIGYIGVPMIADKLKLGGAGKKGDFIKNVGEGMGIIGVMQAANALAPGSAGKPALFPQISGYEENPVSGLGMITEEDDPDTYVSGYEQNPVMDSVVS